MHFRIEHTLNFQYSLPVYLEPLTVRLRPRSDSSQRLLQHDLKIRPAPQHLTESVDLEGTSLVTAWFRGTQSALSLRARSEVQTLNFNPFNFLIQDPRFFNLPVPWSEAQYGMFAPYLYRASHHPSVDALARQIAGEVSGSTTVFLTHLSAYINREFEQELRVSGIPRSPAQVLAERIGACRDLVVLFLDICRSLGLPGRFTSGYSIDEDRERAEAVDPQLHAWAEVYVPGGGWRGYDPSAGVAVGDRHVALASSPDPLWAAPTRGSFRGSGAQSQLDFQISLDVLENPKNPPTHPLSRV